MENDYLLYFSLLVCCIMAWAVGANDLANSMGSSVGAKSINVRTAVILAAIFEGTGALLASGSVTFTLKEELFDVNLWATQPIELALGMLASLMASVIWLVIATKKGWPVSTTHTIVGAIIGFTVLALGIEAVQWMTVFLIILSWFITPVLAAIFAYFLFKVVQFLVFDVSSPLYQARIWLPICASLMTLIIAGMSIWGCLPMLGIFLSYYAAIFLLIMTVLSVFFASTWWIVGVTEIQKNLKYTQQIDQVEKGFGALTVFTACAMAFSHGGNDISNALGPMAAIIEILSYGKVIPHNIIPFKLVLMGAICVVLGLATYGYRIMQTIGSNITHLTPSRAFAAEFSTALIVMTATVWGFPVSTTQTLVGSILGVGLARGVGAINLHVVRTIIASWAFTLPVGACMSAIIFIVLRYFLL